MAAEEKTPQQEPTSAERPCVNTKADPAAASVGRMIFLAIVVVVALLEAGPFLATPEHAPKIQQVIRWVISAFILFRAWQGMPAAILITRLGLALGAIVYLCVALVSQVDQFLGILYAVTYALLDLVMIYSRDVHVYLGEVKESAESSNDATTNIPAHKETSTALLHQEPHLSAEEHWPRCPQCEAPRLTRCPYCHTAGTNFPQADHPPTPGSFGAEHESGEHETSRHEVDVFHPSPGSSCSCGPGGCGTGDAPDTAASHSAEEVGDASEMLVCPTCDEPFHPSYVRQCEWCGHDFGEGFVPDAFTSHYSPVNMRVVVVMIGLVIFGVLVLAYFAMLVPPPGK